MGDWIDRQSMKAIRKSGGKSQGTLQEWSTMCQTLLSALDAIHARTTKFFAVLARVEQKLWTKQSKGDTVVILRGEENH